MLSNEPAPETFFAEWLAELFAESPTTASGLGLSDYDGELGDFSQLGFERRERGTRRWASRLAELGWATRPARDEPTRNEPTRNELTRDDRIDAALVASHLAGEEVMDSWQHWRRDPDVYLEPCLRGVSLLFLHRLRPEPELVEAAVSRLRQVVGVLDCARSQLDPALASPVVVGRAAVGARGGAEFLRESLPREVASPELRAKISEAAEVAAAAFSEFGEWLAEFAKGANGPFALGEERYTRLLRERELLDTNTGALHERGLRAWASLDGEMAEIAARVDPTATDWRGVVHSLSSDHPASPDELVIAYRGACDRARAFLVERELVTMPEGEQCAVEPSPEFLRGVIAVASYEQPPAFAEGGHGHFFVPFPPSGASAEYINELLADNSWSAIPTIAVHEAYPGHHWQLTWARRSARAVRQAVMSNYFVEGWALYAEAMMRRQGFFATAEQELRHVDARIFRAARIVVDTALHSGEMTFDEAVSHMMQHTSLSPAVARAEVGRYCAWPTQASSYLVGALELESFSERWLAEGRGTLREFHDTVGGSPGLPLPLAGELLFDSASA
jgi:uncharacterized protein (DUF885 family)